MIDKEIESWELLLREKELRKLLREIIKNPYITNHMKEHIDASVTGE